MRCLLHVLLICSKEMMIYTIYTAYLLQVVSLIRGTIAERSGIRVGHCIIEINGTSTVGMEHADVVHMLSTTVGDVSTISS